MKTPLFESKTERIISTVGCAALWTLFFVWALNDDGLYKAGFVAALFATIIFTASCLLFVNKWIERWSIDFEFDSSHKIVPPKRMVFIFLVFIIVDVVYVLLAVNLRNLFPQWDHFVIEHGIDIFRHTDTGKYLEISENWYDISSGYYQRSCLAFFPGYPLLISIANLVVSDSIYSALIVSAVFYGLSACVLYNTVMLDFEENDAVRSLKFFAIAPAVFFFSFPLSESAFFFFCISGYYAARRGKWLPACLCGAFAAFTRSVGIMIVAPIIFEMIEDDIYHKQFCWGKYLNVLIIPVGLIGYLFINYFRTGNALEFLAVQSEVWGQGLGFFFDTVAQLTDRAIFNSKFKDLIIYIPGIAAPNLVCIFTVLCISVCTADKIRPSYMIWFIVYFVYVIGAKELMSGPRYLAAMVSLYPMLTELTKNKIINILATIGCLLFMAIYITEFSLCLGVF